MGYAGILYSDTNDLIVYYKLGWGGAANHPILLF